MAFLICGGCDQKSSSETYGFASVNTQQDLLSEFLAFHAWLHAQHFESVAPPAPFVPGFQPTLATTAKPSFWYHGTFRGSPDFLVRIDVDQRPATFGFYLMVSAPTLAGVAKVKHDLEPVLQDARKLHDSYLQNEAQSL